VIQNSKARHVAKNKPRPHKTDHNTSESILTRSGKQTRVPLAQIQGTKTNRRKLINHPVKRGTIKAVERRRVKSIYGRGRTKRRGIFKLVKAEMKTHLKLLEKVMKNEDFISLIPNSDAEQVVAALSPYDRKHVEKKALYVRAALREYLESANCDREQLTWTEACEKGHQKQGRTVQRWYLEFKNNELKFPVNTRGKIKSSGTKNLFHKEQGWNDLHVSFLGWGKSNLASFSIKAAGEKMAEMVRDACGDNIGKFESFQNEFNITEFPMKDWAIKKWVRELGFRPAKARYIRNVNEGEARLQRIVDWTFTNES